MKNKIDREIQKDEIDRMLEEQFFRETADIEAGLFASASFAESLEKRKEGYDRLIARLRENGRYRGENTREFWSMRIEKIRKEFESSRAQNARMYTYAQITAVTVIVLLCLLMSGMLWYADLKLF